MSTQSGAAADRNLLFGILALQMDFINRDQLVTAMNAWVLEKTRPLGQLLVEQKALDPNEHSLLVALVDKHLERHGNDPEKSLAALSSVESARKDLERVADAEVQASLVHVSAAGAATDHPHATPGRLPAAPAPADLFATRVGTVGTPTSSGLRFRILRPHARGGLGQVSVALDEELHREVALKEIHGEHADDPNSRTRFLLEAEVTGRLEHPGIVPVYGLGQYDDGRPYYAMRFIKGDSLKEAIERFHRAETPGRDPGERTLGLRELLGRFVDVCNAIAYAHSRGVLHRDLKPANIMLGRYGETLVLDWGLAKPVGHKEKSTACEEPTLRPSSASGSAETVAGTAVGTPQYMSPEQAAGRLDLLGPASDVYSLGATLYCLLTGQPPFTDADVGVVIQKVQRGEFLPPRQVKRQVPPALEAICLKAMALRPEDRYASPSALADDIEHWLADEPVSAYCEPVRARLRRWGRRHRPLVTAAAVLLVTAVAALSTGLVLLGRKQTEVVEERNAAQKARDQAEAVTRFYEDHVLAAARPKGWFGGAGKDVTLKEALDQAAETIDKAFADQPELEAAVRNTLGMTYRYLGQFKAANTHLEKAYAIREARFGEDHPDTLTSLHNLAMLRWKQGQFDEAVRIARRALEKRRRVLGTEHPETLWTQLNLGIFLTQQSCLDEAEPVLREAIEMCKHTLGPEHHHTLYGQNDLAVLLSLKGKDEEAVALDRQTLDGRRRSLGADHPDTLRSMGNLAFYLERVGQLGEAEALYRQSLDAKRRVLGDKHDETLWDEKNLGDLLHETGNYQEGEKLLRHCVEAERRILGPDHPDLARTLTNLGSLLIDTNRAVEAEQVLGESLSIWEKKAPPARWRLEVARSLLGSSLARQKKFAAAEPLLLAGYDGLTRAKGAPAKQVVRALDQVIELYEKWGKPEQAEAWRKKRPPANK